MARDPFYNYRDPYGNIYDQPGGAAVEPIPGTPYDYMTGEQLDPTTLNPVTPNTGAGQAGSGGATAADPWDTAPTDGNWRQWFTTNAGSMTATPANLVSLEPKLNKHGIQVLRNASGVAGKIRLPDGQIVDVIQNAATGGGGSWQWLIGDAGGGADGPPIEVNPEYLAPFTEQFNAPQGMSPFEFDAADLYADPSYQFRLDQGRGTLENSAAARGLLNSGGTLYDILNYGQQAGSQEFSNAYNRALQKWGANSGANTENYNRARSEWMDRQNLWFKNQDQPFNKLHANASLGVQASV